MIASSSVRINPQRRPRRSWRIARRIKYRFGDICSYDRAGYGWSDTSPLPRTALASVGELHTLWIRRTNVKMKPCGWRINTQ